MNMNIVQSLIQNTELVPSKATVDLRPGQVFRGKILKLFPNHHALLQIGGLNVHAKMEASFIMNYMYWFQVKESKGIPKLKVLQGHEIPSSKATETTAKGVSHLLQGLGITSSKLRENMMRFFVNEGLPFSKEIVEKGGEWLKNITDKPRALDVLKQMTVRQLPLTKAIFDALFVKQQAPPLHQQIQTLLHALNETNQNTPTLQQLRQTLEQMFVKIDGSSASFKTAIQQISMQLGLQYEHEILQFLAKNVQPNKNNGSQYEHELLQLLTKNVPSNKEGGSQHAQNSFQLRRRPLNDEKILSTLRFEQGYFQSEKRGTTENVTSRQMLKPLLIAAFQEANSGIVKQSIEQLLSTITGQQMTGMIENGPFVQTTLQLPLQLGNHFTDLMLRWEGKRQKNGKIDSEHCRILFYLQLEHLSETVVDVQIQKQSISVRIFNDENDLAPLITIFEPLLKEKLASQNYHLSSVKQVEQKAAEQWISGQNPTKSGVDIRI